MTSKTETIVLKGEKFASDNDHYENLRVDGDDLYWCGKKIITEGWSLTHKLMLAAILVAGLAVPTTLLFIHWEKVKLNSCSGDKSQFCSKTIPPKSSN